MKNKVLSLIILFSVLLAFCAPKQPISGNLSIGKEGAPDRSLVVTRNALIFLTLTQVELDSYDPDKYNAASETLWDFYFHAATVREITTKHSLKVQYYQYSDANELIFRYSNGRTKRVFFDTSKGFVALVMFRTGKDPKICYGVTDTGEMLREISDYFGVAFK